MECQLKKWICEKRADGVCLDGAVITAKATQLFDEIHPMGNLLF